MALKLRVISDHYQQLGKQSSRLFGVTGGRIGRSADNDWVLPDPERYISSHHAIVRYDAGRWMLEDLSTNGVFVNDGDVPQSQLGPRELQDGDRLRMGDYDILVSIDERNDFPTDNSETGPVATHIVAKPRPKSRQKAELEELNVELDINSLLSTGIDDQYIEEQRDQLAVGSAYGLDVPRSPPSASQGPNVTTHNMRPNANGKTPRMDEIKPMLSSAAGIDWHLRTRRIDPPPGSVKPATFDSDLNAGLEAFCKGAGVDPSSIGAEAKSALLTVAGQMLREVALGMMEVNKVRGDIKSRDGTGPMLAANENNPLKIATSVDDALRKLLDPQSTRYLPPVEAIRDSFADLRNHQQSLVTAMHSALNNTMSRLDPAQLQDRFDRSLNRGGLMSAANKLKYWDMYAEFYQVVNQRNGDGLPISFADEFAQTYTERMAGFRKSRKR